MTISAENLGLMLAEVGANLSRCMDSASVDTTALAKASGVSESRIAGILAATDECNMSELARFATALQVEPSAFLPALTAA